MIVYHGFSIYEFFWQDSLDRGEDAGELREFSSRTDALAWLNFLGARYHDLTPALRRLLARWDRSIHRLTDAQVLDVAALLLYSGRVLVRHREEIDRGGSAPTVDAGPTAPLFALSDRRPKPVSQTSKPPEVDAPTFPPNIDPSAQANALIAAAASGAPFCPE